MSQYTPEQHVSEIQNAILRGEMSAYMVFTKMREVIAATLRQQAARVDDVSFSTVEKVVKALGRIGHTWPESQEEQAARFEGMVLDLCRSVQQHFDALSAQPAPERQGAVVSAWPKFVQDECLQVLRNMNTELGATGRKSARIERLINAIAGMPAAPVGVPDPIPLDDDVRAILGRMCFQCIRLANRLRQLGHVIENRAEAEQAAVLHWMLNHYLKHGKEWCKFADAELNAAAPSAPQGTQQGEE